MGAEAWRSCLLIVVFHMLEENKRELVARDDSRTAIADADTLAWNETTVLILSGTAKLYADYLGVFVQQKDFEESWRSLMEYLGYLLSRRFTNVNTAVYASLGKILTQIESADKVGCSAMDQVWTLWSKDLPVDRPKSPSFKGNYQDVLMSYVVLFKAIYRLIGFRLTEEQVIDALLRIAECVWFPDKPPYSNDEESPTPLQRQVLESLAMIRTEEAGVLQSVVFYVSVKVKLPFRLTTPLQGSSQSLTNVALSSAAMNLLQSMILENINRTELYTSVAFRHALEGLAVPITSQHPYSRTARAARLWSEATTVSLKILEPALEAMQQKLPIDHPELPRIWKKIVIIVNGISSAHNKPSHTPDAIREAQAFDIASFHRIRDLITPSLGASVVPDKVRRSYTENLFNNSIIHRPEPGELPESNTEILADLYKIRRGRTYDPPPVARSRMCYTCLDELFSLVQEHGDSSSSTERVRLAQAASPFLILRVGLTLRAYIAVRPPVLPQHFYPGLTEGRTNPSVASCRSPSRSVGSSCTSCGRSSRWSANPAPSPPQRASCRRRRNICIAFSRSWRRRSESRRGTRRFWRCWGGCWMRLEAKWAFYSVPSYSLRGQGETRAGVAVCPCA